MRYLLKVRMPIETGNLNLKDSGFTSKLKQALTDIKAEAAYFTTIDGQRGAYIIVSMDDASKMPSVAEPFFLWMKADVEFIPVMTPDDLTKASSSIESEVKKWA